MAILWMCIVLKKRWQWLQIWSCHERGFSCESCHSIWTKINSSSIFKCKLSKFIKLVKIACVQIFRFVKDECCFLAMTFMKNKLRYCLTCHLDMWTCFYAQQFYSNENFHYEEAVMRWRTQNHDIILMLKDIWFFFFLRQQLFFMLHPFW